MRTNKLITRFFSAGLLLCTSFISGQSSVNNNNPTNNTDLPSNVDAFGKGTNVLSIGLGVGGDYTYLYPGYSSTPNFVLTYDNGTFGNVGPGIISLGGLFSYKGISSDYTSFYPGPPPPGYYYTINQTWSYFILGFRAAYHWNFTNSTRFDPYLGLMLAYYDVTYSQTGTLPPGDVYNSYSSYTALSVFLGARYYVSNKVAIWLELGVGYSNAALGVSFKF